ncbi:YppE family protein [Fictibacillus sp. Mic-4]|uniref:YppE family protein n=1 Tax=Fictibacillus TaxID=1329200 RepID=UPI00041895DE|nr:YppE family protein [Fictibacillus gelatini]
MEGQLLELTNEMQRLNRTAFSQYVNKTKEGYTADFYKEVKPFADGVLHVSKQWAELAEKWVMDNRPKYLYPLQIQTTFDNINLVSVLAFQSDTKEKRLNEMIKSIDYVLDNLRASLEKKMAY